MSDQASTSSILVQTDEDYIVFENMVRERVAGNTAPLFTTSASPEALWKAYLGGLPEAKRAHYNCHCCRRFIQNYGGLVKIDAEGTLRSLLWQGDEEVPPLFATSVRDMVSLVASSKVTGVFLSSEPVWGTQTTPDKKRDVLWSHLSARPSRVHADRLLTASQAVAKKLEDYKMLKHALADYGRPVAEQAVKVLKSDALARSEKALGIAEWFLALQGKDSNQLWSAVATAPTGYCHVRSTMISTLLDDIVAGLEFKAISRRWAEKMDPLAYQRPTAAPKEGAIEAAEKLVEKLGVAKSLERRYAKFEDLQAKIWEPKPAPKETKKADGVFGHLRDQAAEVKEVQLPPTTMTWEKFARTVLPTARSLEVRAPAYAGGYFGFVTAADPEAPPILQWDRAEKRNPVSQYVYRDGSPASQWGLVGNSWVKVNAITSSPAHWHDLDKAKHHSEGAYFVLDGAKDSRNDSLCLFPEMLKAEFHEIRAVVEAHSKKGKIQGDGSANGIVFQKGTTGGNLTVRADGAVYVIDRWD